MPKFLKRGLLFAALAAALVGTSSARAETSQPAGAGTAPVLAGRDAVAAGAVRLGTGRARAFALRSRSEGIARALRVYLGRSGAQRLAVGIYASRDGRPATLLSKSGESLTGGGWSTISLPSVPLHQGTQYWLGLLPEGGAISYRAAIGACATDSAASHPQRHLAREWAGTRTLGGRCAISAYLLGDATTGAAVAPLAGPAGFAAIADQREGPIAIAPTVTSPPTISGTLVSGETLAAHEGTWTGSPTSYGYLWEQCDSLGEDCLGIVGATKSTLKLTAPLIGSDIRVLVSATNGLGSGEALSAAAGPVLETLPHPKNVVAPSISGTAREGEKLTASPGVWEDSPTSYAYTWEQCNESGGNCSAISGATSTTLTLTGAQVGHTVVVAVKATNASGSTKASSPATAVVSAKEEEKTEGGTPTNCFENPESEGTARFEACGYPGPKNTAVQNCSELPKSSGSMTITSDGETVENTDITGQVIVEASGVTLHHDCVIFNGSKGSAAAIFMEGSATGFHVSDTTVRAENAGSDAYEESISNNDPSAGRAIVTGDVFEDCGECLHGNVEASNSYLIANAKVGDSGIHRETFYANNGTVIARHDTMLVPEDQTAIIFDNVANGVEGVEECTNQVTVEESLMAGSGQMIQTCGPRATGAGNATLTVKDNRFARCLTTPINSKRCSGSGFEGSDSHGYFPEGGWISLLGEPPYGTLRWEGNFWDDDLKTAAD